MLIASEENVIIHRPQQIIIGTRKN